MTMKLNKDSKTLEEFLAEYDYTAFARPSYCTDILVLSIHNERPVVLLVKRGNHPFIGDLALPGGFACEDEAAEDCAIRELEEETALKDIELEQLITVSTPKRDARGWTVSTVFMGVIDEPVEVLGGDDADNANWYYVDFAATGDKYALKLESIDGALKTETSLNVIRTRSGQIDLNKTSIIEHGGLAFDHAKLILLALEKL